MTTISEPGSEQDKGQPDMGSQELWLRVCAALAVVALVAAVVCAGYFGYRWIDSAFFGVQNTQQVRDEAQDGAEQVILNVTNIDPKNLTAFRQQVDSSLTGNARTQITPEDFETLTQQVDANGANTATLTSIIKRSGVVEFNKEDKTAKVLVYVDVTSTVPNAEPTTSNMGFSVDVVDVDGGWKASDIQSIDAIGLQDPAGTTTAPTTGGN